MKKLGIMMAAACAVALSGVADTEAVNGIETNATDLRPLSELWPSGEVGAVSTLSSSIYDGYLYDDNGVVAGLITVKVGKPDARTHLSSVSARVVGLNGKAKSLSAYKKGKVAISADGPITVKFKGGEEFFVELGAAGMSGHYGDYHVAGSLNVFSTKDEASKAVASAALDKWHGMVNVAWPDEQGGNNWLFVKIAAKGRVKVSGVLANGKTVNVKSQLIVGEKGCCVPVVSMKKGKVFAFNVWLQDEAGILPSAKVSAINEEAEARGVIPEVVGIADAAVGRPGNLKSGAKFHMGAVMGDEKYAQYLPEGVPVEGGEKWTLPKAGRVVQLTSNREVRESMLGENPAALKLTYNAKDGSFKGSFKMYTFGRGRLKPTTVKVKGLLVNGVGYGTATAKDASVPVTIE